VTMALMIGWWLLTPDKSRMGLEAKYAQGPTEFLGWSVYGCMCASAGRAMH
jgi:hypothetical protein